MNVPDPRSGRLLLLGENYGTWGAIASTNVGSLAAAAISVGADEESPSKQFKHDSRVDNEDAVCLISTPEWVGLAVADAHFGPEASHMLISRLHNIWAKVRPTDLDHLMQMIEFLRHGEPPLTESESTLMISVYDRTIRQGFGVSFGDSTFTIVGEGRTAAPLNPLDDRFVSAHRGSLRHGAPFTFAAEPGQLLLAFTDGIDGCHYRNPDTSVLPSDIGGVAARSGYDPLATADGLTRLALQGVRGYPGGQDNIVVASACA